MIDKKLNSLLIFSFAWAFYIILARFILNMGVHPFVLPLQTYFLSLPIMFFYNFSYLKKIGKIKRREWLFMVLNGITLTLSVLVGNYGLKLSTSINYGFLIKSSIIFAPLLAFFFLGEEWKKNKTVLIIMFGIGIWFISTQGKMLVPKLGDLLILLSAFLLSLSNIFQKPVLKAGVKPAFTAFFKVLFSFFFFLLVAPFFDKGFYIFKGGVYLLLAGFFIGILNVYLSKTLKLASLSYTSLMSMLTPVVVALLGALFLKEPLTFYHLLGGGLIFLSSLFVHKVKI